MIINEFPRSYFISYCLWQHPEGHVAQKRAAGRHHLDFASGGARGYGGRDIGIRRHGESCRLAVKVDAGCPCQIGARFDKRPQTYKEAKDRAIAVGPAIGRCPIQVPVGILDEPGCRVLAVRASRLRAKL